MVRLNRRRLIAALAITSCGPWATGCSEWFPARYRYRVTVEVETPSGLRSGSSVMQASLSENSIEINGSAYRFRFKGQAVTVDLLGGQMLFALLDEDFPGWVREAFLDRPNLNDSVSDYARLGSHELRGRAVEVPREKYPKFAHFQDINNPRTAQQVDPDDLGSAFGFKGRIRRIFVTLTDAQVTTGIEKRLPWLRHQQGALLPQYRGVPIGDMPFAGQITEGSFWRGFANR